MKTTVTIFRADSKSSYISYSDRSYSEHSKRRFVKTYQNWNDNEKSNIGNKLILNKTQKEWTDSDTERRERKIYHKKQQDWGEGKSKRRKRTVSNFRKTTKTRLFDDSQDEEKIHKKSCFYEPSVI